MICGFQAGQSLENRSLTILLQKEQLEHENVNNLGNGAFIRHAIASSCSRISKQAEWPRDSVHEERPASTPVYANREEAIRFQCAARGIEAVYRLETVREDDGDQLVGLE